MQVSSVAAGLLRFRYHGFVLAIIFASIIYDGSLIVLGFMARLGLKNMNPEHSIWVAIGVMLVIIMVYGTIHLAR